MKILKRNNKVATFEQAKIENAILKAMKYGSGVYNKDLAKYYVTFEYWKNTHVKPFKHFAEWLYSTRWCDVNGDILSELTDSKSIF